MSDNIPFKLEAQIIKRVPVKALLRFRSVSKQWKSLIDSPDFAADYCVRQSQPHRLLIRYFYKYDSASYVDDNENKYVSVADDDTYHQHQFPSTTLPKSVNSFTCITIVGSSHGLFCFYGYDGNQPFSYGYRDTESFMVVLWNPWIRKSVDVPVPNVLCKQYGTILGFGVSPQTPKDPKIVKINSLFTSDIDTPVHIPWRVEVFTLSSGTWKSPSNNLPCRNSIIFHWSQVALDGVIYWHAFETINANVCGFMKNGEPIVDHGSDALYAYDPYSERIKDLGIVGQRFTFSVKSYMETLLSTPT
uniref:putative F-box protein At1g50870 n=1 Tax=Erigeron canadensis TaxID=72917 RepID=UPI001CB8BD54|nr:putative F-box protein At1g50870 [Erigeron canadensis]